MDWKLGDTKDLKEWIEKLAGVSDERRTEISDLRNEICQIDSPLNPCKKNWTISSTSLRR
jgi:hypothetical protein